MSVIQNQVVAMLKKYSRAEVESRLTGFGFSEQKAIEITGAALRQLRGALTLR